MPLAILEIKDLLHLPRALNLYCVEVLLVKVTMQSLALGRGGSALTVHQIAGPNGPSVKGGSLTYCRATFLFIPLTLNLRVGQFNLQLTAPCRIFYSCWDTTLLQYV
jgi:hypothetical protein